MPENPVQAAATLPLPQGAASLYGPGYDLHH